MRKDLIAILGGVAVLGTGMVYLADNTSRELKKAAQAQYQKGLQDGHKSGLEEGIRQGIYEGQQSPILGVWTIRNKDNKTDYIRMDLGFKGKTPDEYWEGRNPPADMIVITDTREIEMKDNIAPTFEIYKHMIFNKNAPAIVITSKENLDRLKKDDELREQIRAYIPEGYPTKIVTPEQLRTIDPFSFIENERSPIGKYRQPEIQYQEIIDARDTPQ